MADEQTWQDQGYGGQSYSQGDQSGGQSGEQSGGQSGSADEDVQIDSEYSVAEDFQYSLDEIPEELRQGDESSSDHIA
jgi:hypothetical protein